MAERNLHHLTGHDPTAPPNSFSMRQKRVRAGRTTPCRRVSSRAWSAIATPPTGGFPARLQEPLVSEPNGRTRMA
jgi:hypothetical protein